MPNRPEVLDQLGPYSQHGPLAALCELSERIWRTYNGLTAGYIHSDPNSREYLFLRMLYIAELTSTAGPTQLHLGSYTPCDVTLA
jgi:hypothetical protein